MSDSEEQPAPGPWAPIDPVVSPEREETPSVASNPASGQSPHGDPADPPLPATPIYAAPEVAPGVPYLIPPPARPRLIPNFGHALAFFVLTLLMLFAADIVASIVARPLHIVPKQKTHDLAHSLAADPKFILLTEGMGYLLTLVSAVLIFRAWWQRSFAQGIHWNFRAALRRSPWLIIGGVTLGIVITLAGNFLPMPKDPPIMQDMMRSQQGAWLMLIFGVTAAPLFEELAFRGFLLPALINVFAWLARHKALPAGTARALGIPIAVLLTSLPFALMHSQQLSHAWAPLVLIGIVSLVLCVVRLFFDSVAASTMVHASYNLMLFGSILIQTGGFRHLEKLSS